MNERTRRPAPGKSSQATVAEELYWDAVSTPLGWISMLASERGLLRLVLPSEPAPGPRGLFQCQPESGGRTRAPARLAPYAHAIQEFLARQRKDFLVPLDLRGTPFQRTVWDALRHIPYGEVWTYQAVASAIGRPSAARAVGAAIGANPVPLIVPCHRVIGRNGALVGYRGGLPLKAALLALEQGVPLPISPSPGPCGRSTDAGADAGPGP